MQVIKVESISTGQRLKQLVSEMNISNKEFIRQLNTWLKEKQAAGEYREQPEIKEKDLSRWTRKENPVHMRTDKIKLFADFFNVNVDYLQCKQVNKDRPAFKSWSEEEIIAFRKEQVLIELLKTIGYSFDLVPTEIETNDCCQFIDGDLLITGIESYPSDFEPHITDPNGNTFVFDSTSLLGHVEKYIKFCVSEMQPVDNSSHKG